MKIDASEEGNKGQKSLKINIEISVEINFKELKENVKIVQTN